MADSGYVPSPGGGVFEGPGGQAPNQQAIEAQEEFISAAGGAGTPGNPTTVPGPVLTGVLTGLPGHGTTPGQFQPGGGVFQVPQPTPQQLAQGFMARIIPVTGGSAGTLPVPTPPPLPGVPMPPMQPSPPGVGIPSFPGQLPSIPGMPPPTVGGGPIIPPAEGGGTTHGKPKGIRPVAMPKDAQPPEGPPKPPGQWITLDAGFGQPPAYGFIEAIFPGSDSGLGPTPKKPTPLGGTTKPTPPAGAEKGHYIPIQLPDTVNPTADAGDVVWCWVPTIDDTYGVKEPEPEPKK